jgi:hypothetical protein
MASPEKTPDPKRVAIGVIVVSLSLLTMCVANRLGSNKGTASVEPTVANLLGVPGGFVPAYTLIGTERFDIGGTPRLSVRVTVPRGLTRETLELNIRHALLRAYESSGTKLGAVSVLAYASANTSGAYDAATGDFAPEGKWSAASTEVPLSGWRASITFAEQYFHGQTGAAPTD